jgi:hypothetical protein
VTVEKLKRNLIQRIMKIDKSSTLKRFEDLIIQAEMEGRIKESLESIEKGEVSTIEEFARSNQEWLKTKARKL